ncbi:hypothetical protein ACFWPH_34010 [Nocardia sp. NPDC058499]|uniref:hypothetical protein n=1 Tax=Nocardia sp. NPDC058499 TaxID=3346530 RepID=UPI00364A4F46
MDTRSSYTGRPYGEFPVEQSLVWSEGPDPNMLQVTVTRRGCRQDHREGQQPCDMYGIGNDIAENAKEAGVALL